MNATVSEARAKLMFIQASEPLHARVYGIEGLAFCRARCPSRVTCKAASVQLSIIETRVIGENR